MTKILHIEKERMMRAGVRAFLAATDFEVVAESDDAEEGLELARAGGIDVVLFEWRLPGMDGLELMRRMLQFRNTVKAVVLTSFADDPFPRRLLAAGVDGFISKLCSPEELVKGLSVVRDGGRYVCTDVAQRLANNLFPQQKKSPFEDLSNRELQVMMMSIEGLKVQDISQRLCLSPKTVSTYRYRLFDKLGVRGEVELTHLAFRYGLVEKTAGVASASPAIPEYT